MRKKHPGIKPIGRNKYEVRIRTTDQKTGKEKDCKRICNGSVRDALSLQESLRAEQLAGGPRLREMFGDYGRSWFERTAARVRPQTARTYEQRLRHILDALGGYYIDAIRPMDVDELQATMIAAGYSGSYLSGTLKLLRSISRDAQKNMVIDRDFCLGVRLHKRIAKYTEDEPNLLSADELASLLAVIPPQWYTLFAIMAFTGMRWGEASGLQWIDIDVAKMVITIRRTNYRGLIGPTKSDAGRRIVPMPQELYDLLTVHRARLVAEQHPSLAHGWVFATNKGTPYCGYPINEVLRKHLAHAGITKRLTQHGLRRTFNDLLTRVAKDRVARGMLGHTTIEMTMAYSMVDIHEKRTAQAAVVSLVHSRHPQSAANQREDQREDVTARTSPEA